MKKLAEIRKSKGLTQAQLADMAGVDQATISKIERNESYNYTADAIRRLSKALKVEPAELIGMPELQQRIVRAIREISDPNQQEAALVVLESMAERVRD